MNEFESVTGPVVYASEQTGPQRWDVDGPLDRQGEPIASLHVTYVVDDTGTWTGFVGDEIVASGPSFFLVAQVTRGRAHALSLAR